MKKLLLAAAAIAAAARSGKARSLHRAPPAQQGRHLLLVCDDVDALRSQLAQPADAGHAHVPQGAALDASIAGALKKAGT